MQFPKIIHQTWKDENIPEEWKQSPSMWKQTHPDYQYILWTDNDIREYIKQNYPEFLTIHDNYEYNIQRADLIRYFILHDFGGIYSDLDLYPIENIEKHVKNFDSDVLLVNSGNVKNCITNSFMISKKNAPLWKEVHNKLKNKIPFLIPGKHLKVMLSTGPLMLSNVCKKNKEYYQLLPSKKFMAYSTEDDRSIIKEHAILIPLKGQSWNEWDSHVLNFLNKHYTSLKNIIHNTEYKKKLRKSFIDDLIDIDLKLEVELYEKDIENLKNRNTCISELKTDFENSKMTLLFNHKYADGMKVVNDFFDNSLIKKYEKIKIDDFILFVVAPLKGLKVVKKVVHVMDFLKSKKPDNLTKELINYHVRFPVSEVKRKMQKYKFTHTTSFLIALQAYTYYKNTGKKKISILDPIYIPWIIGNNKFIGNVFIVKVPEHNQIESIYHQVVKNKIDIIEAWGIHCLLNFFKLNIESIKLFKNINIEKDSKKYYVDICSSNIPISLDLKNIKLYKNEQNEVSYFFSIGTTDGYVNISLSHYLKDFGKQYIDTFNSL